MKTNNLKWIAYALSALMLMQSCRVYHSKTATMDEVILSKKRVLAKNYSDETYKFKMLQRINDQLYGTAKRNSITAKKLSAQINEDKSSEKFVKIQLPENSIKELHFHNKSLSTILSIAIPAVVIIGSSLLIYDNNNDWGYGSGGEIHF